MKRIEWKTNKGTAVELTLVTSKTISLDGDKSEVPCYRLQLWIPSLGVLLHDLSVVTHPVAGLSVKDAHHIISIAPDVASDVTALIAEYRAEMDRRTAEWIKGEREYEAHCKRMAGPGCPNDPNAI